jgi:hypothetical protein
MNTFRDIPAGGACRNSAPEFPTLQTTCGELLKELRRRNPHTKATLLECYYTLCALQAADITTKTEDSNAGA